MEPLLDSTLITKIKEELNIYCNFTAIVDKLDKEGHLKSVASSLDRVFVNEIDFALKGRLKRSNKAKNAGPEPRDTKDHRVQHLRIQREPQDTTCQFGRTVMG